MNVFLIVIIFISYILFYIYDADAARKPPEPAYSLSVLLPLLPELVPVFLVSLVLLLDSLALATGFRRRPGGPPFFFSGLGEPLRRRPSFNVGGILPAI